MSLTYKATSKHSANANCNRTCVHRSVTNRQCITPSNGLCPSLQRPLPKLAFSLRLRQSLANTRNQLMPTNSLNGQTHRQKDLKRPRTMDPFAIVRALPIMLPALSNPSTGFANMLQLSNIMCALQRPVRTMHSSSRIIATPRSHIVNRRVHCFLQTATTNAAFLRVSPGTASARARNHAPRSF